MQKRRRLLSDLLVSDTPIAHVLSEFMAQRYECCRMVVENSLQLVAWELETAALDARVNMIKPSF
jgi:hypothetical protein